MSEKIKSIIKHPLFVGIVCSLGVYYYTTQYKELSYTIEPSEVFMKNPSTDEVKIIVNDIPVKEIFSHRIQIWNSGNLPIKDVPFDFFFPVDKQNNAEFKILNLSYSTNPKRKFGKVVEGKSDWSEMEMSVGLMNPGDMIGVRIITNQNIQPEFFSKSEGVIIVQGSNSQERAKYFIGVGIITFIAFCLLMIRLMRSIERNLKTTDVAMKSIYESSLAELERIKVLSKRVEEQEEKLVELESLSQPSQAQAPQSATKTNLTE